MGEPVVDGGGAGGEYLHGHAEPVLRSHVWRTAENSAGYLLGHLRPTDRVLDVGCGPGTITADLARLVPDGSVLGVDRAHGILDDARRHGAGIANLEFGPGDVMDLPFPDDSFDVVHAHQVLQHLPDPVAALREMARVTRSGGLVAVRDADYGAFTWAPGSAGLDLWRSRYRSAARALGAEPDAGRHLLRWCHAAGLGDTTATASVWCFAADADRRWWGGLWADRVEASELADRMRAVGATDEELTSMAAAWRASAVEPDGWFVVLHGEAISRVGDRPLRV